METSAPSDPELLADWLGRHREPAFHALVARYAGLVHATARRICGDDSMAAEASQLTFIALARKAHALTSCASLGGWLHTTAMMQAKNLIRKSQRENRKRQLLQAAMENESHSHPGDAWKDMQPVLDAALAALSSKDREALLLRFYRSLSIRETAETLGIATDAAQKRIDRATERLRGKLARRGCQVGASLSVAMLSGFAADAQAAALPVSVIASNAIAAGTVSSFSLSAIIATTVTIMKSSSWIPPVVSLLIVGSLIGSQRHSISTIERESVLLRQQLAEARASSSAAAGTTKKTATTGKVEVDLKELAAQVGERMDAGDMRPMVRFEQLVEPMTKEELAAALEEIATLDLSDIDRPMIESMIINPLVKKDMEFALSVLIEHVADDRRRLHWLSSNLKDWAEKDPTKAQAWFDQQIAAGKFDSKALDGRSQSRIRCEGQMIGVLLGSDTEAAARRLAAMPEDQRGEVMRSALEESIKEENQPAYADIIRKQLPAKEQAEMIAIGGSDLLQDHGFAQVDAYLDRIAATPEERAATVTKVAVSSILQASIGKSVTREDLDAMRGWVGNQAPDRVDNLTGTALGTATLGRRGMKFADAAALAQQYDDRSGNQEVLAGFLESAATHSDPAEVRELARKIADEKRREEILKKLK